MDCTTCTYEYTCDWSMAEAGSCEHYRPDLDHEEAEDET